MIKLIQKPRSCGDGDAMMAAGDARLGIWAKQ